MSFQDRSGVARERPGSWETHKMLVDRSVVGVMNEFAFPGEHWFEGDLATLVGEVVPRPEGLAEVIAFPGMATRQSPPPVETREGTAPATEAADAPNADAAVFQLKVTLLNTKPPIWRRILVDGSITLDGLHEVIQAAFGWWNCHLHEFEIGSNRYGVPDPDWDFGPTALDERTVRLDAVAGEGTSFHYTYDFGDNWRHKVTVEKVGPVEPRTAVPDCIGGRRACPPEDCGGPWGYQELLESLGGRPGASDARLEFLGPGFDPAAFDPAAFDRSDFALNLANLRNTSFDL